MTPLGKLRSGDTALISFLTSNPVNRANQESDRVLLVHATGIGFSVLVSWPAVKGCTSR